VIVAMKRGKWDREKQEGAISLPIGRRIIVDQFADPDDHKPRVNP